MRRRVRKDPIISKLSTIPVTCPQRPAGMSDVPICAACAPPASRVSPWGRLTANLCRGQGLARCSRKLDRCQLRPSHDPPSSPYQTAERVLAAHARPSFASAPEGADGAPRGAPGVEPHAYRVACGALARRRSNPSPKGDDRLSALRPWRLSSPGKPAIAPLRRMTGPVAGAHPHQQD
jgi:hypothetical protein